MLISLDLSNSDINNNLTFKIILYTILNGKRIPIEGINIQIKEQYQNQSKTTYTYTTNHQGECFVALQNHSLHEYNYDIDINSNQLNPYNSLSFFLDPLDFEETQEYYLTSLKKQL